MNKIKQFFTKILFYGGLVFCPMIPLSGKFVDQILETQEQYVKYEDGNIVIAYLPVLDQYLDDRLDEYDGEFRNGNYCGLHSVINSKFFIESENLNDLMDKVQDIDRFNKLFQEYKNILLENGLESVGDLQKDSLDFFLHILPDDLPISTIYEGSVNVMLENPEEITLDFFEKPQIVLSQGHYFVLKAERLKDGRVGLLCLNSTNPFKEIDVMPCEYSSFPVMKNFCTLFDKVVPFNQVAEELVALPLKEVGLEECEAIVEEDNAFEKAMEAFHAWNLVFNQGVEKFLEEFPTYLKELGILCY